MESFNAASHENHEPEVLPGLEEVRPEIKKPVAPIGEIKGGLDIINEIIKEKGDEENERKPEKGPTYH